ncbi:MAG TPA: shikimate dehydrogenase [Methylomirabilota bacterium]|nr:shikimate dehydrogenase [Methylomirabilota bacterium]
MPPVFPSPIGAATRYCAVLGRPIKHSASPAMQNAGLAALGLDWRYLAFEVDPTRLREAIAGAKAMHFIGLNLTVPHKLLALELMDVLDESARTWGAVNTVRFEGLDATGQWRPLREFADSPPQVRAAGFNTDADAITRSLREDLAFEPSGARILLLGAGGAGRTAALKLAAEGAVELHLVNRTADKAAAVAAEIRQRFPRTCVAIGYPERPVDLVLNATSLGLRESDASPLDETRFALGKAGCVYDMIYRPAETPLLRAARAAGRRAANGIGMLLYQGARALELWTGVNPPIQVMREALERNVYG